jgi:segregation and condensation protein B
MNDEKIEQAETIEVEIEVATIPEPTDDPSGPDAPVVASPALDEVAPDDLAPDEVVSEGQDEGPQVESGSNDVVSPDSAANEETADFDEALVAAIGSVAEESPAVTESVIELDEVTTDDSINATREEIKPVIECLLFVAEEPLPFKVAEYDARGCGLEIREVAGGWRISTRPQNHDFIRKYLKTRPSARLSLPALETLAVIAYKQPITVPEILEIRGVSSSSAIKTLLEKRLIVTRGRKETVGRPMMYGTSRDFLIQFGLKDLSELPSIEDFEDLAQ